MTGNAPRSHGKPRDATMTYERALRRLARRRRLLRVICAKCGDNRTILWAATLENEAAQLVNRIAAEYPDDTLNWCCPKPTQEDT